MNRCASGFTGSVQARDNNILSAFVSDYLFHKMCVNSHLTSFLYYSYLSSVVGRNTAHIVVHGGQDGNRFASHVNTSEDHGSFGDARKTAGKLFRRQVVELKVNVILVRSATTSDGKLIDS